MVLSASRSAWRVSSGPRWAIKPRHGHIVVAILDGEFAVKKLYQRAGRVKLLAGNPTYPPIIPGDGQSLVVWGVVTSSIKRFAI